MPPFVFFLINLTLLACAPDQPPAASPAEKAWAYHDSAATQAFSMGRLDSAAAHLEQALNAAEPFAPQDERRLKTLGQMGYLATTQGYPDRAESYYQRMLKIQQTYRTQNDPQVLATLDKLAALYAEGRQYARAESLYSYIFSLQEPELPMGDPLGATTLNNLAKLSRAQNRVLKADSLATRAMALKLYLQGYHSYVEAQYKEAESLYHKALAIQETRLEKNHPDLAMTTFQLGLLYDNQGKDQQAATFYRKALAVQTAHQNHKAVALIQDHLDQILARQTAPE